MEVGEAELPINCASFIFKPTIAHKGQKLVTVLYEEQIYWRRSGNKRICGAQTSDRSESCKYLVKEEGDVLARSSQHTVVRALRGEYASVTQKLCRDEHTGGGG